MADITMGSALVKPKLGLGGAAVNAMALIAPGAFLWITGYIAYRGITGSTLASWVINIIQ